jgi:hypothetical protein
MVREAKASSSPLRVAPSAGVQRSIGLLRRASRPRRHKQEPEHRLRGARSPPSERQPRHFVGIKIASEPHGVALVTEAGDVVVTPMAFSEDASGSHVVRARLGAPDETLVALEAPGHD